MGNNIILHDWKKFTWTRVLGIPSRNAKKIQTTSPMFEGILYLMKCFVLLAVM